MLLYNRCKQLLVQTHLSVGLSVCQSVCPLVQRVYCGKMADWVWMPFGVMSGISRGMGVLDGVEIVEEEGAV